METNAPKLVGSLWAMVIVSVVFLALRLVCKGRYGKGHGWDDYLLVFCWVCVVLYAALLTVASTYGYGRHLANIAPEDLAACSKFLYIGQAFIGASLATSKTSFAVTLLRIVQSRWQKFLLWFFAVSLIIAFGLLTVLVFISCSPVEKLWNTALPGRCWEFHVIINYSIFVGAYSAVMDIVLAAFPSLVVWQLPISREEKTGVILCTSLGFLAGVVAIIKTTSITNIAIWNDFTFSGVTLSIWAAAEIAVTIIATSIPYFRLAIQHTRNKSKGYRPDRHDLENIKQNVGPRVVIDTNQSAFGAKGSSASSGSVQEMLGERYERGVLRTGRIPASCQINRENDRRPV